MLLVDLTASVPYLLRDNCFMCVRDNNPFGFIFLDQLVILVRHGCRFELNQVSEIHRIMKNTIDNRSAPQFAAVYRILLALSLIVIFGRTKDLLLVEPVRDFPLAQSLQPQLKDVFHHRCSFGIDNRQMIRIITTVISVRDTTAEILACLCTCFKYSLDFFACGTAVPFIEQVDDRHHVKRRTAAVSGIHIVVQSNKTDIVHRKNIVDVAAHFNVISAEA